MVRLQKNHSELKCVSAQDQSDWPLRSLVSPLLDGDAEETQRVEDFKAAEVFRILKLGSLASTSGISFV
jgi:hypothetical protein